MNQIEESGVPGPMAQEPSVAPKRRSNGAGKQLALSRPQRATKAAKRKTQTAVQPKAAASRETTTTSPPIDEQPAPADSSEPPRKVAARDTSFIIGTLRRLRAAAADYIRPAMPDQSGQQPQLATAPATALEAPPSASKRSKGPAQAAQATPQLVDAQNVPETPPDTIPEALRIRYLVVDDKFYFRDREQTLAFEDHGKRITTAYDDAEVAHAMVTLAQAKGWTSLKLRGSDEFKREAWLAAALQGMEVSGYRPNDIDKARLAERQDERAHAQRNIIERKIADAHPQPEPAAPAASSAGAMQPTEDGVAKLGKRQQRAIDTLAAYLRQRGDSEQAVGMTVALASEQMRQRRAHFGKLVEHGPARYKNDPEQEASYFATLQTERGRQTIWGVDLERAISDSGVAIGEDVLLSKRGARDVTVPIVERDPSGRQVGERAYIDTHRNDWEVSSLDGARDFMSAKATPGRAVPEHALPQQQASAPSSQAISPQPKLQRDPEPSRAR